MWNRIRYVNQGVAVCACCQGIPREVPKREDMSYIRFRFEPDRGIVRDQFKDAGGLSDIFARAPGWTGNLFYEVDDTWWLEVEAPDLCEQVWDWIPDDAPFEWMKK